MTTQSLLCPQCGLELHEGQRCPECGGPLVPEESLRLRPSEGLDARAVQDSHVVVARLRDPFEGDHLVALLETRRIPAMIEGGRESALAAGWVDHRGAPGGVLLVPKGRREEAELLIQSFRDDLASHQEIDEEALAEEALAAGTESGQGEAAAGRWDSRPEEGPAKLSLMGAGGVFVMTVSGASLIALAALFFREGRPIVAMMMAIFGVIQLRRLPVRVQLDRSKEEILVWPGRDRLLGRPPTRLRFRDYDRLQINSSAIGRRRSRWELWLLGEDKRVLLLHGRHRRRFYRRARAAASLLGLRLPSELHAPGTQDKLGDA